MRTAIATAALGSASRRASRRKETPTFVSGGSGPPAASRWSTCRGERRRSLCAGHLMIAGANPNTNNLLVNLEILSCEGNPSEVFASIVPVVTAACSAGIADIEHRDGLSIEPIRSICIKVPILPCPHRFVRNLHSSNSPHSPLLAATNERNPKGLRVPSPTLQFSPTPCRH